MSVYFYQLFFGLPCTYILIYSVSTFTVIKYMIIIQGDPKKVGKSKRL